MGLSIETTASNAAKYDRQLRLWGDAGQIRLENCHICLINASSPGVETLKNLVLPGIGAFTIIDTANVTNRDVGNNFFLGETDIGKNRGEVCCKYLLDLNPDVRGLSILEPLDQLFLKADFFKKFTAVIICYPTTENQLLKLSEQLWTENIPIILPRVCGLWASVRLVLREHYVIEAHPEGQLFDLRLDNLTHVPGLKEFIDTVNLEALNKEQHMHTPYLIVLVKYLEKWMSLKNSGSPPRTYKERKEFQELLRSGGRRSSSSMADEELNFEEAIKAVNTAFTPTSISSSVQKLFESPLCLNISAESSNFWIIVRAIKEYVSSEGNGCLPVQGVIPDMTSDSERYIKLQTLYQDAAKQAAHAVFKNVQEILRSVGRAPDCISPAEVRLYCKNASHLDVLSTCSLQDELISTRNTEMARLVETSGELDPQSLINVYILMRTSDEFFSQFGYYPGDVDDYEGDVVNVRSCLSTVLSKIGVSSKFTLPNELIDELVRFGGGEVHSMSSFIGGVAAHEVIKLVTNQYVPLNDLFIYSAITSSSETIKF